MLQNVLRDAWAYQEILQEGREEGLQQGRQEGLQQALQQRLEDQRQVLITFIQKHFPNLTSLAKKRAKAITDPEMLQSVVLKLLAAQTEEEAKQLLRAVAQEKKPK